MNKRPVLILIALSLTFFMSYGQKKSKPNILFIAVDDLKPELGCYGNQLIKTPNIDRLAKMGTVFAKNYCQQAVCGPSRASIMTGLRPDVTKVWDLKTKMREANPDIVTIPQYFITQGYVTEGVGKIYHPGCADKQSDGMSWSVPYFKSKASDFANGLGMPAKSQYQDLATKAAIAAESTDDKGKKENDGESVAGTVKPSSECLNLPDDAYEDGVNALIAKRELIKLSNNGQPYFLAVGFHKPHLPFVAPKKYWDLYNRADMPLAPFQEHSENGPLIAYHKSSELRNYTDIPAYATLSPDDLRIGLKEEKQKELIHGYYAAVSYMDAQVGILLNTLDSLGELNNTIIVLWGDHGWHLGDHDLWEKHTNFENATRSPLIFVAPGFKSGTTSSLSEHLDVFPTLCDLANVPIPDKLQGKSLKPVMQNKKKEVIKFAVSQYPRKLKASEAKKAELTDGKLMGYSIRSDKYRYTVWLNNSFASTEFFSPTRIYASELYDYVNDPLEKVNVVTSVKYKEVVEEMNEYLIDFMKSQEVKK